MRYIIYVSNIPVHYSIFLSKDLGTLGNYDYSPLYHIYDFLKHL